MPSADSDDAVLLLGDLNAVDEEVRSLCVSKALKSVAYFGLTWGALGNKFHAGPVASGGNTRGLRYDWMLYRGFLCAEAYVLNERRVFFEGAQFHLSDHYALLGFLDVHPCYGSSWRQGQAAARAGRGQLTQLRDRAIVLESRQAKEMLRLGQEEVMLSRQRIHVGDVCALQREQVKAARRRRDARASAYSKAFGGESLFAPDLRPEYAIATGCPVAPSIIGIRGFDSLR